MDIKTVNSDLINFFAVAVVFLIGVAISFKIFCKTNVHERIVTKKV